MTVHQTIDRSKERMSVETKFMTPIIFRILFYISNRNVNVFRLSRRNNCHF